MPCSHWLSPRFDACCLFGGKTYLFLLFNYYLMLACQEKKKANYVLKNVYNVSVSLVNKYCILILIDPFRQIVQLNTCLQSNLIIAVGYRVVHVHISQTNMVKICHFWFFYYQAYTCECPGSPAFFSLLWWQIWNRLISFWWWLGSWLNARGKKLVLIQLYLQNNFYI